MSCKLYYKLFMLTTVDLKTKKICCFTVGDEGGLQLRKLRPKPSFPKFRPLMVKKDLPPGMFSYTNHNLL